MHQKQPSVPLTLFGTSEEELLALYQGDLSSNSRWNQCLWSVLRSTDQLFVGVWKILWAKKDCSSAFQRTANEIRLFVVISRMRFLGGSAIYSVRLQYYTWGAWSSTSAGWTQVARQHSIFWGQRCITLCIGRRKSHACQKVRWGGE